KGEAAKVIQRLDEVMREGPLPEELNEIYLWAQALNSAQALEHLGQFSDAWTALTTGFPSANQGFGEATKLWQRLEVLKEVEERLKQAEVPTLTETEQLCTRGRRSLEGALTQMMRQLYLRLIDETMRSVDPSLRDAEKARLVGDWPELTYSKSSG